MQNETIETNLKDHFSASLNTVVHYKSFLANIFR